MTIRKLFLLVIYSLVFSGRVGLGGRVEEHEFIQHGCFTNS